MTESNQLHCYVDVISGKIKPITNGPWIHIQYVGWLNAPVTTAVHYFRTIGRQELPKAPALPKGFVMVHHPRWGELVASIKQGFETANFDYLDLIQLDLEELAEIVGDRFGDDCIPYESRRDWSDWSYDFDESWDELLDDLDKLYHFALPHKPPHSSRAVIKEYMSRHGVTGEVIGNRVKAPSLARALQIMLENVLLYEAQKHARIQIP
jgi:hypothetical protein